MRQMVFVLVLLLPLQGFSVETVQEETRPGYEHFYREFELALHFNTPRSNKRTPPSPYLSSVPVWQQPLLVNESDADLLRAGLSQLARAGRSLLADVFSGDPKVVKAGLIKQRDLNAIAERYGYSDEPSSKRAWINRNNEFDFVVAADIHRGIDRNFLIELNVDTRIVGLSFQSEPASVLSRSVPEIRSSKKYSIADPTGFYSDLDRRLSLIGVTGDRIAVMRSESLEKPKHRYLYRAFGRAFTRLGWNLVMVDERSNNLRNLPDGSLEFYNGRSWRRVGYAFYADDTARLFSRRELQPLLIAQRHGQLRMNVSPGAEILGDKALLPYWQRLVEFYLGEKMIYSVPRVLPLADDAGRMRRESLGALKAHPEGYYIKSTNGDGGYEVLRGDEALRSAEFMAAVEANPNRFVLQEAAMPSRLYKKNVDIRPFAFMTAGGPVVSHSMFSRNVPSQATKMNLGSATDKVNSNFTAVVLVKDQDEGKSSSRCRILFN